MGRGVAQGSWARGQSPPEAGRTPGGLVWDLGSGPILSSKLQGTFPDPSRSPCLSISLETFGSFLWIYTTMITAAISQAGAKGDTNSI